MLHKYSWFFAYSEAQSAVIPYLHYFLGAREVDRANVSFDVSRDRLVNHALQVEGASLTVDGNLSLATGDHSARSVKDRYIVVDMNTRDNISWGKHNQPFSTMQMERIWQKVQSYLRAVTVFGKRYQAGVNSRYALEVTAITEFAWHQLYLQNMLINETAESYADHAKWTLVSLPNMKLDPEVDAVHSDSALFIDFTNKRIILCGLRFPGEMQKALFSVQSYLLPVRGVLPMHCAVTKGRSEATTLVLGLPATGKTTLSSDPQRSLLGDDAHGWSMDGVFNLEDGSDTRCLHVCKSDDPMVWHACKDSRAILMNVAVTNGIADYADASLSRNARVSYPRSALQHAAKQNSAGAPESIVFLSCDLYGILPPVSILSAEQAMFWYLNGYSALFGSSQVGSVKKVQPTFSSCYGAAFLPRSPQVYADLFRALLEASSAQVYLVNTGWTGGVCGAGGRRIPVDTTRKIMQAIHTKEVLHAPRATVSAFSLQIPTKISGVQDYFLDAKNGWEDLAQYKQYHEVLYKACMQNFQKQFVLQEF